MKDYSRYKLKKPNELLPLIKGSDNISVISCKKCFKEFSLDDEPETFEFIKLANQCDKKITSVVDIDFLCNETFAEKALAKYRTARHCEKYDGSAINNSNNATTKKFFPKTIFVIACGLGTQVVADLMRDNFPVRVFTACDSIACDEKAFGTGLYSGERGQALTKKRCGACGQCYLDLTGGICPVVDCSKSLLNGQCGGSKNRKCEIDIEKECAWDLISQRLYLASVPKNIDIFLPDDTSITACRSECNPQCTDNSKEPFTNSNQQILLRDYSKVDKIKISRYVKSTREKRLANFYGGLYLSDHKSQTEHLPLEKFKIPEYVIIPLLQHIGIVTEPLVKPGDVVKTGQKIGMPPSDDNLGCPLHSSVSGMVTAVEPRRHPLTGKAILSVVIASDGKDELHESVEPVENWECLFPNEIISIIKDKGIVGMGGAGFPTHAKICDVDTVILNGCECAPFLTTDHRVMIDCTNDVISGLKILLKATGAKKGIIAIEDNKADAVDKMVSHTKDIPEISIASVKTKYPHGAEKMLVKHLLKRQVPQGGHPVDVGVLVTNVKTSKALYDAFFIGIPLIERAVTVSGDCVKNPGNYLVRIGTSAQALIDYCGGIISNNDHDKSDIITKFGGPMMGHTVDTNAPILKTTNGILALTPSLTEASDCIRCGRCSDVCPMELIPLYFAQYARHEDWESMKNKSIDDCIECRCCDFICPSKIRICDAVKMGKQKV